MSTEPDDAADAPAPEAEPGDEPGAEPGDGGTEDVPSEEGGTEDAGSEGIAGTAETADIDAETTEYTLSVFRGDDEEGEFVEYDVPVQEGMVVLDAIHWVQANEAPDLAVRWNCKSGRCGSCSVEIDGMPKLACMTRMADFDPEVPITVTPMTTFPVIKDLVPDVSWNYEVNESIEPFTPAEDSEFTHYQEDVERAREFRKCIECFLCQDVCHVLREHDKKAEFAGPRFFVRSAGLHFHPEDTADRTEWLADAGGDGGGVGYCNITRCCSNICPENIEITDNAIIPQKEAVVDEKYDPLRLLWRRVKATLGGG